MQFAVFHYFLSQGADSDNMHRLNEVDSVRMQNRQSYKGTAW